MQRKSTAVVSIAILLIGSVVTGAIVTTAEAESENVKIADITISPETPTPGEPFQVTAVIENLQGGGESVEITDVYIRDATGLPEYERVENLGTIGDGQSMEVPFELSVGESKNLRVHVVGRTDADELVKLSYPLYVNVEELDDVHLSMSTGEATAGGDTPVNVTVVNGGSQEISNVEIGLGSDSGTVTDARRVSASVGRSSERLYGYTITFGQPGNQTIEATASYETPAGYERTIRETITVEVDPLVDDTYLTARTETRGSENILVTRLTNFGNLPIEDVQIGVQDTGDMIDRSASPDIQPYSSTIVELNLSGVASDDGEVVASYTVGEHRQTITQPVTFEREPEAEIELTSVEVIRSGNTLTLRGDASNIGESYANGVLVSIIPSEGVKPISPSKKYFVGGIEASEFGTFELTARTTSNVSVVPVRVEYSDDGERISEVVDLDTDTDTVTAQSDVQAADGSGQQETRGPFSMLTEIPWKMIGLGLIGTIVLIVGAVYLWRRNGR